MNRGLVNGLFHALGTSRLQAGTVCDTCCEEAWNFTVGPVGGADPEDVVHSDLVISWGADLAATNVHFWSLVEHTKKARPAGDRDRPAPHAAAPRPPTSICRSASALTPPSRSA